MKAAPLLIAWHNDTAPVYSAHVEPQGRGRLATAGGDNNVRLWKIDATGEERKVTYLSTLAKHTQAVNVVRWCPRGELLASAGDDGNVLLWGPSESHNAPTTYGEDNNEDKETWIVKRMCRSQSGAEIYDIAWSPDGLFFVTGSMDNVARIFDAQTGNVIRQIAEHNHYVQGVAWDPLNEFLATQSSDRSVHIYKLRTNDGQFSLAQHGRMSRMDLPARRPSSNSPAPPDFGHRSLLSFDNIGQSPGPSAPSTPQSLALPMNPPSHISQSRRSSFGGSSPSVRRSASPAPSMPLPAVMPPASPNPLFGIGAKNASIYANETFTSFFRRLTFTPDGSLLFTPAGQYKTLHPLASDGARTADDVINTVYVYSRAGLNKPPIAHLPGHKKPSVAVRCCPVYFNLRLPTTTKQITIDTSSASEDMAPLPDPILPSRAPPSISSMEPPSAPSPSPSIRAASPKLPDNEPTSASSGPPPAFALPYRIVYAVATQDAVYVYDTQQQSPLCVLSNLHHATFTDLTWSNDGLTLLMASSDGYCSSVAFAPGELGTTYHGSLQSRLQHPTSINASASSQPTPLPTPSGTSIPTLHKQASSSGLGPSTTNTSVTSAFRPASPSRTNSASSIATQSSFAQNSAPVLIISNPTPSLANMPSVAAAMSAGSITGASPATTAPTPPMTPHSGGTGRSLGVSFPSATSQVLGKRDGPAETDADPGVKKRRIAPTLIEPPGDPPGGGR